MATLIKPDQTEIPLTREALIALLGAHIKTKANRDRYDKYVKHALAVAEKTTVTS